MTNNTLPKNRQPQPDKSPDQHNISHTYLTSDPSRTHESAIRSSANSKSVPSPSINKQAAYRRWKERVLAYDRANPQDFATGAYQPQWTDPTEANAHQEIRHKKKHSDFFRLKPTFHALPRKSRS